MDYVIYGSIVAVAIIALVILLTYRKKNEAVTPHSIQDRNKKKSERITRSRDRSANDTFPHTPNYPVTAKNRPHSVANQSEGNAFAFTSKSTTFNGKSSFPVQSGSTPVTMNGEVLSLPASTEKTSNSNDTSVLLLLPSRDESELNTDNAFKSPQGNRKIFSLYSDFVNEVSGDVLHVTDSFLHEINSLIDSNYRLVHDEQWRQAMEQNGRLAHMTSKYVKRYRYPHYAGHIHQMLSTCLSTLTRATDLINESLINAMNGDVDLAHAKLKSGKILLKKSPNYIDSCNTAMGTCFIELSRHR